MLNTMIQTINGQLEAFDYEIRSMRDQQSKETMYALVNNTSDALTQFATTFSANEIAYIRRLLDHMFETNNTSVRETMAVKHTEASQLARASRRSRQSQGALHQHDTQDSQQADTSISIADADMVLDRLVAQAFLHKSRAGYYSLAPRALMELRAYLKETYNDDDGGDDDGDDAHAVIRIRDCEGCREIVTYGVRCNNRECGVRWHDACANSYYRGRRDSERKCPRCKTECTGDVFVGERADTMASRKSQGGRRGVDEEEEAEEEEYDE